MDNSTNCFCSASSMIEVKQILDKQDTNHKNCWVIFDVDYTLTIPSLFFSRKQQPVSKESFFDILIKYKDKQAIDRVLSSVVLFQQALLDTNAIPILDAISKTKRVFAFTACTNSAKIRNLRSEQLNRLGINFQNAFEFSEVMLLDMPEYLGCHPGYHNGILYSNGEGAPYNKGSVLISFMNRINQFPNRVVLIDDRKKNLQDVDDALQSINCEFLGVLYSDKHAREKIPVDILEKHISRVVDEI